MSGRKGTREGRGRSAGEGGRKGDRTGRPQGKSDTVMWKTAARNTTAEQAQGGQGKYHRDQVSRAVEGGDYRAIGANKGGSNDKIAEWRGANSEETEGSVTEEEAMTAGGDGVGKGDADGDGKSNTGKRC